jgi:N-acetylneuraminate synthase
VKVFEKFHCPFTLMHCVSIYPLDETLCNLKVIRELRNSFDCPVGWSGHEVGILPSILAVAMGATVIERHICRSRADYGSDQAASLEKRGMELLARDVKMVAPILGDGRKIVLPGEMEVARKLKYWENHDAA